MPLWAAGIVQCANTLRVVLAGHTVVAAHRSDTADRAMPPWSPVEASVDVVCRLHQRINDVYDVTKIDVVVVGIFHQVRVTHYLNMTSLHLKLRH